MRRYLSLASAGLLAACAGRAPAPNVPPVTTATVNAGSNGAPPPEPGSTSTDSIASTATAASPFGKDFPRILAKTNAFRFGTPQQIHVTPDGKFVLFLRSGPQNPTQSLFETNVATGTTRDLLDAAKLLGEGDLSPQERARRERQRLLARGFAGYELSKDGAKVLLPLSGRLFVYDRATEKTSELQTGEGAALDPHFSPDGKWVGYVRDNDVRIAPVAGGPELAVTHGGTEAVPHGLAEFIAQEELARSRGYWFSPDGARIVYEEADTRKVELMTLADLAHPDRVPERTPYPRPGKANADVRLGVTAAGGGGATTWLTWDHARFPYIGTVRWDANAPITIYVLDRLQKNGQLLAADPKTGATKVLLEEHDDAWLNLDPSVPRWLPDGKSFLWSSESRGSWQLEQRDANGTLMRALTPASLGYEALVDIDATGAVAIVNGSGEPTETGVFAVPLDGSARGALAGGGAPRPLIGGSGQVDVAISLGGRTFAAVESSTSAMARYTVRSLDDAPSSAAPADTREIPQTIEPIPYLPKVEIARVGEDETRVAIVRPTSFVAGQKYPVIDAAYAGPHVNVVVASARSYLREQWMADTTGAIVVSIDAQGTPRRGRAWERVLKNKLAEVPLAGHVATLAALGKQYPEMDTSRVGVYGASFGGFFAALAVLARPDIYKVAYAASPPADWRDYDTCYTERYLETPETNAAAYDAASLLTYADKKDMPARPLLILHGTEDDNVFFVNSLKLVNALERAGKPFEFTPILGATHRVADPDMNEEVWRRGAAFLKHGL